MRQRSNGFAVAATLGAAALFATSATSRAISGVQADSVTVATVRLVLGAAVLVTVVLVSGRGTGLLRLWRQPLVWVMALGVAGYQALFFIGTARVGVAVGTLASLALGPLMAGLLAWALGAAAPSRAWWFSTLLAIVGLAALTLGGASAVNGDLIGILAAVGAGSAYAVYTVFGARLAKQGNGGTDVLAASFAIGALLLVPFGAGGFAALATPTGIALSLWLGIAATGIAYLGFGIGISQLSAGTVATLNLAEPVVATVLGLLVVGESLSALSLAGGGLIALALTSLAVLTIRGENS